MGSRQPSAAIAFLQFGENPHCFATTLLAQHPVDMQVFMMLSQTARHLGRFLFGKLNTKYRIARYLSEDSTTKADAFHSGGPDGAMQAVTDMSATSRRCRGISH
jgi:hypothetical protein